MPTIRISRKHQLPHHQVRSQVEKLAGELAKQLGASCRWDGDTLRFSRSGASGLIQVTADSVEVEVRLSTLLSPFKDKVEQAVADYLDEGLA